MNMSNLTEHKCAGKCPEFKGEQCHHCLVSEVEMGVMQMGNKTEASFAKDDLVVYIDSLMPNDVMKVTQVQEHSVLLDGNRKFALQHLIRHATHAEKVADTRHIVTIDELVRTIEEWDDDKYIENHISAHCQVHNLVQGGES